MFMMRKNKVIKHKEKHFSFVLSVKSTVCILIVVIKVEKPLLCPSEFKLTVTAWKLHVERLWLNVGLSGDTARPAPLRVNPQRGVDREAMGRQVQLLRAKTEQKLERLLRERVRHLHLL